MPSRSHRRTPISRRRRLGLATGAVLVAGAIAVPAVNATTESAVTAKASAKRLHDDFNGDGFADVAIGAPGTTVNTQERAGSVSVLYGSASGLATSRKQVLKGPGVKDPEGWRGLYGSRLESGDLDGDGYADLVSVIQDYKVDIDNGHTVQVNWGGPSGLSAQPTTIVWTPLKSATTGLFTVADVDGDQHPDVVTLTDDDWLSADPEKTNGDGTVFHGPFDREGTPPRRTTSRSRASPRATSRSPPGTSTATAPPTSPCAPRRPTAAGGSKCSSAAPAASPARASSRTRRAVSSPVTTPRSAT